jgi:hypothetical protein
VHGHLVECLVHAHDLPFSVGRLRADRRRQREPGHAAAAAIRQPAPRNIDDDRAHHPSGPAHEVGAIPQAKASCSREAEIRFVHQRGRVEQRVAPARAEACAGKPLQLVVDRREQPICGIRIAFLCPMDEFRQAARVIMAAHCSAQTQRIDPSGGLSCTPYG